MFQTSSTHQSPRDTKNNTIGYVPNNASIIQSTHRSVFDPSASKFQDVQSIVDARKLRLHRENEVRKLHNRIAILQEEEEKALRRIEDTRAKAQAMLEFKIEQEQNARELFNKRRKEQMKLSRIVQETREQEANVRFKVEQSAIKKREIALQIKQEQNKIKKKLSKNDTSYLRRAQERRFELQVM
jgi:hypothetical protein